MADSVTDHRALKYFKCLDVKSESVWHLSLQEEHELEMGTEKSIDFSRVKIRRRIKCVFITRMVAKGTAHYKS